MTSCSSPIVTTDRELATCINCACSPGAARPKWIESNIARACVRIRVWASKSVTAGRGPAQLALQLVYMSITNSNSIATRPITRRNSE